MLSILRTWVDRYFAVEEAVLLVILLVAGLVVMLTMGTVLAPMIAAVVIAFLMQGVVVNLKRLGLPHWLAVAIAFVLLMGFILVALLGLMPVFWQQTASLFKELPRMLAEWQKVLSLLPERYPGFVSPEQIDHMIGMMRAELGVVGQTILSFSLSNLPILVAVLIYIVLVPLLVFFFLKDSDQIMHWLASFLPKERPVMRKIWLEMNLQIANYVRGKAIEILVVGLVSYIAFLWLGLNYAELLGLAVGLSVVVPYIGAAVVTLPVALIGFFQWGWGSEFFYLLLVYGVIQALDGNVLVPLLFSEAVNLHPVAIILAVLVFGGLWGLWGVFFAIPLATLIKAILNAWPTRETVATNVSQ